MQDRSINPDTNEIFLHSSNHDDDIDNGIDHRVASQFIKNFHYLDSANDRPIIIHLNSIGGVITHSFAIYDIIRQSQKHVTIVGHGGLASMATVIFQAADLRIAMPNCEFMLHNIVISADDLPHHALKHESEFTAKLTEKIFDIYAEKCKEAHFFKSRNLSASKVKTYLKKHVKDKLNWYLDANQAVEYGLCDHVLGNTKYPTLSSLRTGV